MYNININFIEEEKSKPKVITEKKKNPTGFWIPTAIKTSLGILVIVGAYYAWNINQKQELENKLAKLREQIGKIEEQKKTLAGIKSNIEKINNHSSELAQVFNQINPWSAILEEVRQITPPRTVIQSIGQSDLVVDNQAKTYLDFSGYSLNYEEINQLLLNLHNSPLIDAKETKIVSANIGGPGFQNQTEPTKKINSFEFKIKAKIKKPNQEILRAIESKGAVGITTRMKKIPQQ